jgi:hypothetical protein
MPNDPSNNTGMQPTAPNWNPADAQDSFNRYFEYFQAMARFTFLKDKYHEEVISTPS